MSRNALRRTALVVAVALAVVATVGLVPANSGEPETPDYEPTFESLSKHPTPNWFEEAKFGIFMHWGPYSVPAWRNGSEWYWRYWHVPDQFPGNRAYHGDTYGEDFPYDRFAEQWQAESYDPESWVNLFEDAGAKYFVLTSKHHDGWSLWDTATTDRDTVAYGPHRDLVGELFEAAEDSSLRTGVYYSLIEWFHPLEGQLQHGPTNPYTGESIPYVGYQPIDDYVMDHQYPQMVELVDQYDPDLIWCDIPSRNNSNAFMAHYFNQAKNRPDPKQVAVNDRCGNGISDYTTFEKSVAPTIRAAKWESAQVIDDHWGWGYMDGVPVRQSGELIHELVDVVSKNGNLLLNVGPKADGTIAERHQDVLRDIGAWLRVNGEAIYGTTYWAYAEDPQSNVPVRYTVKDGSLYAIALGWPGESLRLSSDLPLDQNSRISLLGSDGEPLEWGRDGDVVTLAMPEAGAAATTSQHAYTFKITTPGVRQVMRNVLDLPETAKAGEPFTATLEVTNPARSTSPDGRITLDVPAGWSVSPTRVTIDALAAGESRNVEFEVTPPAAAPPARHVLKAYADFGRVRYQSQGRLLVGIAGFRNVAVGKPATQKTTAYGGVASRAVDGNTDGVFGAGSVSHTAEPESQAWWQVDLGESVEISDIALWNRTDCCADRLSDYYVMVSDQPFEGDTLDEALAQPGVTSFHHNSTAGRPTRFPVDTTGRYIRVQLASTTNPLSLAEVEVLTPIPSG
jgi:alpha-L-fucosidase